MNADKEELNQTPEAPEDKAPDQDGPELSPEDEALMQRLIKIDEETGLFSLMAEIARATQTEAAKDMVKALQNMARAAQTQVEDALRPLVETYRAITEVLNSDAILSFKYTLQRMREALEANRASLEGYVRLSEELQDLSPYMLEELQEERYHDLIRGESIPELLDFINNGFDENGTPTGPIYQELLERAKARKKQIEEAEELQTQIEQAADLLESLRPSAHTMANNALINKMQEAEAINAGPFDLLVSSGTKRRKELTAYTMINYEEESGIQLKLSEYERQVSDAIISLWIEAKAQKLPAIISPDMVYRAMPGGGEKASPQQKGAIVRTIEKFRRLHITIDATEEMRKRGIIGERQRFKLDDFFLSAFHAEITAKNGGQAVSAYRINTEPLIYTYSKATKQLLTVKAEVLDIRKVKKGTATTELLPMNADRQAMTGYLMRRIEVMRHNPTTQSPVILFRTLFNETGQDTTNKVTNRRNREFCFNVLDYWKAIGHIKDYKVQTQGNTIRGIQIVL